MTAMGHSIGARIRRARRDLGWTQQQLADAIGVCRSAVAQWETDRSGQELENLSRVATALDIDLEWLIDGVERRARQIATKSELRMIQVYRKCAPQDRQILLAMARALAQDKP